MRGIAHISFNGGGVFLPARNPYDREMLVEHITDSMRTKSQLRVLVDDLFWSVLPSNNTSPTPACDGCGNSLQSLSCSAADGVEYCVKCAFGDTRPEAEQ